MGIFYQQQSRHPFVVRSLDEALKIDPSKVPDPQKGAAEIADEIQRQLAPEFSWRRLLGALIIVAVTGAAGMTAAKLNLTEWSDDFPHSFEILLGIVAGMLGGESAAKR